MSSLVLLGVVAYGIKTLGLHQRRDVQLYNYKHKALFMMYSYKALYLMMIHVFIASTFILTMTDGISVLL